MGKKINERDVTNSEGGSNGMPLAIFLGKGLQGKCQEFTKGMKEHVAIIMVGKVGKT
jgi:hypothetical protein